jgi:hypothetical protein
LDGSRCRGQTGARVWDKIAGFGSAIEVVDPTEVMLAELARIAAELSDTFLSGRGRSTTAWA